MADDNDDQDIVGDAVRSTTQGLKDAYTFKNQRDKVSDFIGNLTGKLSSSKSVQAAETPKVATNPTKTTLKVAGPKKFTIRKRVGTK